MAPRKRVQPSRKLKQTTLLGLNTESTSPVRPLPKKRASTSKKKLSSIEDKQKSHLNHAKTNIREDDDDDDDDDDDAGLGAIKLGPKVPSADSGPSRRSAAKKRKVYISDNDSEIEIRATVDKTVSEKAHPKGRVKGESRQVVYSDSENSPPRRRRKLVKGRKPLSSASDDVSDEVEADRILDTRLRTRGKKTTFQKNLEKLKRRKQGKPSESSESNDDDDDEDGSDEDEGPIKGAKPHSDYDSLFDEDSDKSQNSSDFIVEDDGADLALLPTQFSMDAHQDLAHQFKKIFQFFVHIAVRPAMERHEFMQRQIKVEEYFSVPLQVARRKISGLRDSLVASSVWRPEFKKPLETYPEFDLIPLDFAVPACDACHLGGRMSTLTGRLSGFPYDRLGFELQDIDSDGSDNSEDSDNKTSGVVEFSLGRFCAKRTRVFHEFTHWEYSLFRNIRQEVDDLHAAKEGKGFFRIAYAGGKHPPDDLGDADGICDWLDERKVIDMEWQKVKDMMESARHLEMAAKRGDDD